ncbi:MAG: SPOR domain-containing protein, partial [Deltaproteobacteria bacterium]|nr:SPOR domain-containing protein [Deltaproteobacteria bacterium]
LAEEKISAATVRKIRKAKGLLKDKTLQELISRMQSRLSLKIFLLFVLATLLATLVFVNKDYIDPLLNKYLVKKPGTQGTIEETRQEQIILETTPKKPVSEVVSIPVMKKRSSSAPPATKTNERTAPEPPATVKKESPPAARAIKQDHSLHVKATAEAAAGDTLSSMARDYYHVVNITMIDFILQLNPSITNPDLILIKQKIRIPEITDALMIKPSPDGSFMIHLATFLSRSAAIEEGRNITLEGKEIKIVPRQISDRETWYRVMAGPYADWNEAVNAIADLQKKGLLLSFPN